MSDRNVEQAKEQMNVIERLLKGLPGISSYIDKELRRDADKRLRDSIVRGLEEQKQTLLGIQKRLLSSGGLQWLGDVDAAVQKLQTLADRIKTASYGYAGLFDPVRVKEEQLKALHRFDVALAERLASVEVEVKSLSAAVAANENVGEIIAQLTGSLAEINNVFSRRSEAIVDPTLLTDNDFIPEVSPQTQRIEGEIAQAAAEPPSEQI